MLLLISLVNDYYHCWFPCFCQPGSWSFRRDAGRSPTPHGADAEYIMICPSITIVEYTMLYYNIVGYSIM